MVSFYIKPADGLQLPEIMQWIKQTFACRYNAMKRLDGHVWGDRYWSKVMEGEPPEEEIAAGKAVRGDCVESDGEWANCGGAFAKGAARRGQPPRGGNGGKCPCTATFSPLHRPLNRLPSAHRPG
jgi:hypothetical protein